MLCFVLFSDDTDDTPILIHHVDRTLRDTISPTDSLDACELRAYRVGQAVLIGPANVDLVAEVGQGLDRNRA